MRSSIISFILLSVTSARPQFEVLKSIVSEVVGDIEQVPYTVLQKFDVSFFSGYFEWGNPNFWNIIFRITRWGDTQAWTGFAPRRLTNWGGTQRTTCSWNFSGDTYIALVSKTECVPQVHLWRQHGAGEGGHDHPCSDKDEDAGEQDGEQGDVLLPEQGAPGQPAEPNQPRGQDCEERGAHGVRAHLRRLRQQGLSQLEGRQAVCWGAEEVYLSKLFHVFFKIISIIFQSCYMYLSKVLRKAGQEVDTDLFYTASYDSPMKFWNRRNEVMFLVPGTSRWALIALKQIQSMETYIGQSLPTTVECGDIF